MSSATAHRPSGDWAGDLLPVLATVRPVCEVCMRPGPCQQVRLDHWAPFLCSARVCRALAERVVTLGDLTQAQLAERATREGGW